MSSDDDTDDDSVDDESAVNCEDDRSRGFGCVTEDEHGRLRGCGHNSLLTQTVAEEERTDTRSISSHSVAE